MASAPGQREKPLPWNPARSVSSTTPAHDKDYIGAWLCERGRYQEYIAALSRSNPNLKRPDPANRDKPLKAGNAKVVLLQAGAGLDCSFAKKEFKSITDLREHFAGTDDQHDKKRIYIMEGLAPDFIADIGGHFFMDPAFFQRQERTCVWSNEFTPTSDALPMPSLLDPETMFHLQYCELRQFNRDMTNQPFFCKRTGRHVGMTAARANEKTTTGILRRKAAWWSRETTNGGWDVVILCDPRLEHITSPSNQNYSQPEDLVNTAFQDGYVDFVPPLPPDQVHTIPAHPHHSMLEDLSFYLIAHAHRIPSSQWIKPAASSIFLKKIIAAHYLQLIDYIKAMLPSLELRLTTAWKEEQDQWKSLQTISRRCGNYSDDIEDTLVTLGYRLEASPGPRPATTNITWLNCETDFQYIYMRLRILKSRADTLMQAMTGLASIAGNRQNLEEAKRVKRLNFLALFFIPLAYTSSLFSMQDAFAPGMARFWVYWVCAILVVAVTLAVTWVLDSALDDAAQWTLGPLAWLRFGFWEGRGERLRLAGRRETIYGMNG